MSINITKISEAMAFASMKHIGQVRKSTGVAYISHPSAVSMILFDMKADTDTIVAGLLHDTVEDTDTTLEEIIEKFGQNVANLVDGVSEDKTKTWEERKQHTINSLLIQNTPTQFITFADKLHNLQSLLDEYSKNGDDMWSAFKRGRDKQEWYYRGLLEKFGETSIPKHSYDLFKSLVNKLFPATGSDTKSFYRVCNNKTKQGLWYTQEGIHTGHIHDKFDFCLNSELKMDFDEELIGWLSAVETIDDLYKWFTKEDILKLQNYNYFIFEYEVTSHKFYDRFQHSVICQETSTPIKQIIILE